VGATEAAGTENGGRDIEARTAECDADREADRDAGGGRLAELLDCLSRRGVAGRKAQEFLESAHGLLAVDAPGLVCRGEAVAYFVREAADSVLKSADTATARSPWRELSQRVLDAKYRYDQAARFPEGDDSEAALADLLGEIDALDEFKRNYETPNEVRAAEIVARLTGSPAQRGELAPMIAFLGAHKRASDMLHSRCSVEDAERLLWECEDAMLGLLRSPADREGQLSDVAGRDCPGDADLEEARRLIGTDRDLEVFLGHVGDPEWLVLLNRDGRLDPPVGRDGWWAARSAAVRLSVSHRQEVTDWLVSVAERRPGDAGWCAAVVGALLGMEDPDIALALRFAEPHQTSGRMLWLFGPALEDADPSAQIVFDCACVFLDILVEPEAPEGRGAYGWNHMPSDLMGLLKMVADGADENNAADRIEMLLHKMRRLPVRHGDLGLFPVARDRQLPAAALLEIDLDGDSAYEEDPEHALGGCLASIMGRAMDWLPAAKLLDLAEIAPEGLSGRLRTWILAAAGDSDPDAMAAEIEQAIGSRRPNCDDVALIDRIAAQAGPQAFSDRWRAALGEPPTEAEARQALESTGPLPEAWRYQFFWHLLLPEAAAEAWIGAPGPLALAEEIGHPEGRDYYTALQENHDRGGGVEAGWVSSPLSADDLRPLGPERAAAEVASWRPQPMDWPHSYRLISQELEKLVKEDPAGWLADPPAIAEALRHPTYIAAYLRAAARAASDDPDPFEAVPVAGLVDVLAAVQSEPWPAEQFGGGSRPGFDYDSDWTAARQAGTELAKALVESGIGLAGRDDDVWDYLVAEARTNPDRYEPVMAGPGFAEDPVARMLENASDRHTTTDPLQMAINQAGTRAVDAALSFMAAEHKETQAVRAGAADLLEWCLRQPGLEGAKHRAIIAPHTGRLSVIMADWFDRNHPLLFGADAPGRLGQIAVDMAVKWSPLWEWLAVNYRDGIYDSAARGVERSCDWVLVAMLHGTDGYKPRRVAQQLDGRIPQACLTLARLIDRSDKTPEQMEAFGAFCDAVIEHKRGEHVAALGRLVHADSLDCDTWTAITLKALDKTGGWIGQSHAIVERILENPPTPQGAAVLARLVEVQTNPALPRPAAPLDGHRDGTWTRRLIADGAGDWLSAAVGREPGDEYDQLEEKLADHGLLGTVGGP